MKSPIGQPPTCPGTTRFAHAGADSFLRNLAPLVLVLLAGCASRERPGPPTTSSPVAAPSRGSSQQTPPPQARPNGESATRLAAYEVRESAFSDFGMSLRTNFDVRWGGHVEWMEVSPVDAGSSAARMGLSAGDRIMAIDGRLITELDRDTMLDRFFQRKKGEVSRVLVLGVRDPLPRFINLVANRP